jgi:DNA repair photolyase
MIEEKKEPFGTRELSEVSFNIGTGCQNNCRYCFAAYYALNRGKIKARQDWQFHKVFIGSVTKSHPKYEGTVMFPTCHDFHLPLKGAYLGAIGRLLEADNDVLITTKARLKMVEYLCENLTGHKDKVRFMFTITSLNEEVSEFWEPNAPSPFERVAALKHAFDSGYKTSVIVEPLLEGSGGALSIYDTVLPYVAGEIWFGLMEFPKERVDMSDPENAKALERLSRLQSFDNIRFLYNQLNGRDKVRWKKGLRDMMSRPEPEEVISFISEIE